MGYIVSMLCLYDAVNTILASPPRWRHLSHQILTGRNLEFDHLNFFGRKYSTLYDIDQEYLRRVSKYLQQYQGNKIDSFKLQGYSLDASCVDDWISFALTKGVEELHLALGFRRISYVFPQSLHVGSTLNLKHLSLKECILSHPTCEFDVFNRLTTLLSKKRMTSSSNMNPDAGPIVAGDRLTHLKLINCEERTKTEISALNLASLEYISYCTCMFFSIKAPRLSRIFFSNKRVHYTLLPQALIQFASCPGLQTLHLQIPAEIPRISSIPTYGNLKQLTLDIDLHRESRQDTDNVDVNFVLDLFKAAPLMEELVILVYGGELSETNLRETRNHSTFTNDHLRMVEIQGFRGNWYDTELVNCILEISPKLEKLVIDQLVRIYKGDREFSDWREERRVVVKEELRGFKTDAEIVSKNV